MMIDFCENVAQCVHGHPYFPMLWLQAIVDAGEIRTKKRKGEDNTADIGTKAVTATVLRKHLKTLKMERRDGRQPLALSAALSL